MDLSANGRKTPVLVPPQANSKHDLVMMEKGPNLLKRFFFPDVIAVKTDLCSSCPYPLHPTARMTNTYQYSIAVDKALASYGAKTHGSLDRRVERLKRFTDLKNKQYADDIKVEHARMIANQEREERMKNRVRDIHNQEFLHALDKRYGTESGKRLVISTGKAKEGRRNLMCSFNEAALEVEIPMATPSRYNLRSRQENGLNLLWQAIQNGFVNTNRG